MDRLIRRRLIRTLSGGLLGGLAGCLGGDDGENDDESDGNGDHDATEDDNEPDASGDDHDETDDEHTNHNHDHTHELGAPVSEIAVEMVQNDEGEHFVPHVVHVEPGGTVEWVLETGSHDTVAYHPDTHSTHQRIPDGAEPWESDRLSEEGDTFERTFDIEGVYDYVCTPHEGTGMIGSIIVGWPDPDEQPGLEAPSDDHPDAAAEQLERSNEQIREVLENGNDHDNDADGDHEHEDGDHDDHDH